jgi:hypothetical protein
MRMRSSYRWLVACLPIVLSFTRSPNAYTQPGRSTAGKQTCRRAVMEGVVHEGQGFQAEFARGLVFGMEPIRSGWVVRVVAAGKPRGAHDRAQLATLPYESVSPLLLSTDWAFRAQDAVGWTPRRFHFAATESAYQALAKSYDAVLSGDQEASRHAALLAEAQPEGLLEIEDAKLAPGRADQTRMAAAVSGKFTQTPHTLDTAAASSLLGRIEEVRFRVSLDLPAPLEPSKGMKIVTFSCLQRPTATGNTGIPHN